MTKSNYKNNIIYKNSDVSESDKISDKICEIENNKTIGEKCSIKIAKDYNIYDNKNNNIIDYSIIKKEDANKINLYNNKNNIKNYKYKFCNDNGEPNCCLKNKNIWLTKNNNNKCEINNKITIPPWKSAIDIDGNINKLKKPENHKIIIDLQLSNNSENDIHCEERWYDWFTIPDFHNGNKYSAELSSLTTEKICYKPCNFGSIPIGEKDNLNYNTKCINRDLIDNGKFKNTFPYTPYSMIILLGSTKKDLIELYKSYFNLVNNIIDEYNKGINNDYSFEINNDILNEFNENNTSDIIIENIKKDIKIAINNIITEPISHLNIIPPVNNINEINYKPISAYQNKNILLKAYNISKNLSEFLTNNNLEDKFYNWKKELILINDLDINSWEFNKLLLLLEASCKCCFGNHDNNNNKFFEEYSNYIMSNIVKFNDDVNIYKRINFPNYKKELVLKSLDTNNPINNFKNNDLKNIDMNKIKEYQLNKNSIDNIDTSKFKLIKSYIINFNNHKGKLITDSSDLNLNKSTNMININLIENTFSSNLIVYINFFLLSLLMIIYLYMCYNLIIITWKNFSNVLNYIIMGFIWIIASFISIFTTLFGYADNTKGYILNIHKFALKGELYYGYYTQSLAKNNAVKNYLFNGILLLGILFIFLIVIKTLKDSFEIF